MASHRNVLQTWQSWCLFKVLQKCENETELRRRLNTVDAKAEFISNYYFTNKSKLAHISYSRSASQVFVADLSMDVNAHVSVRLGYITESVTQLTNM